MKPPFHLLWLIPLAALAFAFAALKHATVLASPRFAENAADLARQQDLSTWWIIVSIVSLGLAIGFSIAMLVVWGICRIRAR